ncbi:MAG: CDF family Co(II)/Ni(II) efflux transporter DmeF [Neisseria sp.]|nr:CDF family Co(II)/Ni(II) efflux transporter DmeF [Neisseria sp.]
MNTVHQTYRNAYRHDFGQGGVSAAEKRTLWVTVLTALTMVAEIVAGYMTGSMALLADGIHMGTHALALGLAAAAYYLMRRYAHDRRLSLGSGKISDLAAYSASILLLLSTAWLVAESVGRLLQPQTLYAAEAMTVAVIGLVVNMISVWLLAGSHHHHDHEHSHHEHHHEHGHHHEHERHDANLQAAVLHVMADAVTSVAAIVGIAAAWWKGWWWLDPLVALAASMLILRWGVGLLRQTAAVLLDREADTALRDEIGARLQQIAGTDVVDLHIWSVGQGAWTMVAAVVCHGDAAPSDYKALLADMEHLHHPMVEVEYCHDCP